MYQDVDSLVDGAFGNNVLNPGLVHIHGSTVLEDGACSMEVLRAVQLVGSIKEEVSRLVSHRWEDNEHKSLEGNTW